ncbi:MAG TPA: class I SAM-dependent methyltransferase [Candidatus Limnocylindrales bacterium]
MDHGCTQSAGGPYYRDTRHTFPELISVLDAGLPASGRALDVGCSFGYLGETLLKLGYAEVWGIEPEQAAAREAATRLTRVICAPFPNEEAEGGAPYELIVFADTLEHLLDPWDALSRARELLSGTGQLLLSVPNVSHYSVLLQQFKGRWTYADQGLLDRTHLRFFTPATIAEAVARSGFVSVAERSSVRAPRGAYSLLARALRRRAGHLFVYQHVILGRPDAD